MSASSGIHAYGAILEYSTDSGSTYNSAGEIVDCDPPPETVAEAEATHLLSDNAARERKPGLSNTDKMKATLNFVGSQYSALKTQRRVSLTWRITLPKTAAQATNGDRFTFTGFWTSLHPTKLDPKDEKVIQANLEVSVSGIVTYAAGS